MNRFRAIFAMLAFASLTTMLSAQDVTEYRGRRIDRSGGGQGWQKQKFAPLLSLDGKHFAIAKTSTSDGLVSVFHDGHAYGPINGYLPDSLRLSQDGSSVAWLIGEGRGQRVIVDGKPSHQRLMEAWFSWCKTMVLD